MKLDLPRSEWIRIIFVIFTFSILSAWLNTAYQIEMHSSYLESVLNGFWTVFPLFLVTCIPFHLYARRQNWSDDRHVRRDRYLKAGGQLGVLAGIGVWTINFLMAFNEYPFLGVVFLFGSLLFSCFMGSVAGILCSYSFFAFAVTKIKKYRFFVVFLWLVLLLPAVLNSIISCIHFSSFNCPLPYFSRAD